MPSLDEQVQTWLTQFLTAHEAAAGTVHVVNDDRATLALVAAVNIPPQVQSVTATVARGKGMAGLAWEREQPVSTCNLQEDDSGDVRPGAKAVDAQAAVALPIARAGEVRAVVGLAWMDGRVLDEDDLERLRTAARLVPIES